jgi:putative peptide zinc metalloprotease protein
MTDTAPSEKNASLADSLRSVQVGMREDLSISRHRFRGEVAYIVRDPMTFENQRLSQGDYEVFVHIRAAKSLGDIFIELVKKKILGENDGEHFYQFVVSLHGLGFLRLPVSNDKLLYERFRRRKQAAKRARFLSLMYLRVPLLNPNAFLDRTIHLVRPLFSLYALALWVLLIGAAVFVAVSRWDDLVQPVHGVLVAQNLPLLALLLIVLKVFHEFGHAFACKHFGGHVPEMGAVFIMFAPCAYVDATGSWSFPRTRERVVVCLAGMYIESIFAAVAVFVWAATDPSLLNSIAYNVMFLAGAMTVFFNINPLMRYDGYYVLCDLVEVPNLRQRSTQYFRAILKRAFLGVPIICERGSKRLRAILLTYGVSVSIYRALMIITIAAVLAYKMRTLGLIVGVGFGVMAVTKLLLSLLRYLWHHEETAHIRWRAVSLGLLVVIVVPVAIFWLPLPATVHAAAVVVAENEAVVRTEAGGFVHEVVVEPGARVEAGSPVLVLINDTQEEAIAQAAATFESTLLRRDAFRVDDPSRAQQEQIMADASEAALAEQRSELAKLTVRAPADALVADCIRDTSIGMYVSPGYPVAMLVSGNWHVRAIMNEDDFRRAGLRVDDAIEFRAASAASRILYGRVLSILPAGSRRIETTQLTHLAGGDIAVDPDTHEATQPFFEIRIVLDKIDEDILRSGMTGFVRLPGGSESIGHLATRKFIRFWNRLVQEQ